VGQSPASRPGVEGRLSEPGGMGHHRAVRHQPAHIRACIELRERVIVPCLGTWRCGLEVAVLDFAEPTTGGAYIGFTGALSDH
jgi:hypothetical protein